MKRVTPQERILEVLRGGLHTWDEIKALTSLNDDRLGVTLGNLLDMRQIWTAHKKGVRVYGIEKRLGLVPRFPDLRRRATDT